MNYTCAKTTFVGPLGGTAMLIVIEGGTAGINGEARPAVLTDSTEHATTSPLFKAGGGGLVTWE
jgi:hypothetical protein